MKSQQKTQQKTIDLSRCAPIALGVVSGVVAVLCLWVGVALMQIPGARLVAFAAVSGALFWASGAGVAVLFWIEEREREDFAARREALRAQLKGAGRTTA